MKVNKNFVGPVRAVLAPLMEPCLRLHSWSQTIRSGHLTLSDPRNSFKTLEIEETSEKSIEMLEKSKKKPRKANSFNEIFCYSA